MVCCWLHSQDLQAGVQSVENVEVILKVYKFQFV